MNRSWRYLAGLALLLSIAAAVWFNREQTMTYVVVPVSRLSWLVLRTLMVIDQQVYWGALIFVVTAFGLRFIPWLRQLSRVVPYAVEAQPEDRAERWSKLIREAAKDNDAHTSLSRALTELREELAAASGVDPASLIPPADEPRPGRLKRYFRQWTAWLRGGKDRSENEIEADVRRTLAALESLMERKNGTDETPAGDR